MYEEGASGRIHRGAYPWKFPGTVILRLTRAFITLLTISYRDPDMFLLSFPSKRRSTSSLRDTQRFTNVEAKYLKHRSRV